MVLTIGAGLLDAQFPRGAQYRSGIPCRSPADHGDQRAGALRHEREAHWPSTAQLFARLEAIPGVLSVGGTTRLPLGGTNSIDAGRRRGTHPARRPVARGGLPPRGAPLLRRDEYSGASWPCVHRCRSCDGAPPVVVINEAFATAHVRRCGSDRPATPTRTELAAFARPPSSASLATSVTSDSTWRRFPRSTSTICRDHRSRRCWRFAPPTIRLEWPPPSEQRCARSTARSSPPTSAAWMTCARHRWGRGCS